MKPYKRSCNWCKQPPDAPARNSAGLCPCPCHEGVEGWTPWHERPFVTGPRRISDVDRAVLDAADKWYGWACSATRTGHPAVDELIAAVRARRETQPIEGWD